MNKNLHIVVFFFSMFSLYSGSAQTNLTNEQYEFINKLLPVIAQVNSELVVQREGIYNLFLQYKTNRCLTNDETYLIYRYLKFYRCKIVDDTSKFNLQTEHFKCLLKKVDIIPKKLVLAQAAIESDWGKSRFAKEGDSFFGIRCNSAFCGLKPLNADSNTFLIKSYQTPLDGIRDYTRLLNSSIYYEGFRDLRVSNRLNTEMPDPLLLARGLEKFSSRGKAYVDSLIFIMKTNLYQL